ncbi:Collagen triple helix incomplete domain containing protein [Pandoravirus macleodensis]|uniref:Collagen triple helix incomplete domain containing protein n=1 Tax=Pandoravirus macleodensis TaxID=2107707 RepID=A0A2U7UEP8_9VIRU|nr:Collagen triple helix incomplete domain containing protein [Pandoravirus macleodensis]AVK76872.1 Collagen triple helix incomplete domain containing protein [Pandoravirus macleodensis]
MAGKNSAVDRDLTIELPEEVMAHLLASLPKGSIEVAARVCCRWRATAIALADVSHTRGSLAGRMGLRMDTIDHAAAGGHKALVMWLREVEHSPWSQDTAVAALRGGHLDLFEWILADHAGKDVLGTRLAATSVAYGGIALLERLQGMGCPIDGWTLMIAAAVLPLDSIHLLLHGKFYGPAHIAAALLGRVDLLAILCDRLGMFKFTPALQGLFGAAVVAYLTDPARPRWIWSNRDSDLLCDAVARSAAGLSAQALADLLLDLQRKGYVATMYPAPQGLAGPRGCTGVQGPQGLIGPRGPTGPRGCAGV